MISDISVSPVDWTSRRHFLAGAGAVVAFAAAPVGFAEAAATTVKAQVFPIAQPTISGPYPEQSIARYSAASGKWGVAFSGGGSRAFSAALGQMRGLTAANVLGNIGAISCVSGGTWFGTPYTFASASIPDTELLGKLVQPGALTVEGLETPSEYPRLAALMNNLTNTNIKDSLKVLLPEVKNNTLPVDKLYSRVLNRALLRPYNLSNTNTQFTLDQASLDAITSRNPGLQNSFYLARPGRPFFIAGGTQIMPLTNPSTPAQTLDPTSQTYRSIEYTPLYVGAPQFLQSTIAPKYDYGGGYVESFAFNTSLSSSQFNNNIATVQVGKFPFILSDLVGSSSAAPEATFEEHFNTTNSAIFPQFEYWPVPPSSAPAPVSNPYSFGDGGTLEDTGVVALLRRGYQTIFAFVNTNAPLASVKSIKCGDKAMCNSGIAGEISQLFGCLGEGLPSTQVFENCLLEPLIEGLMTAQTNGGPAVYAATYQVMSNNPFGIVPYSPKIFWIYNALDTSWFNQLSPSVAALLTKDPILRGLSKFPYYETVLEDPPEIISLRPLQVHLLADMWAYSVSTGFSVPGFAFGHSIA